MFKKIIIFLVFLIINSCLWSPKKWSKLEDKKFYFQKFKYSHKCQEEKNAFNFMKSFQIKEISEKLEKKYGIKIDYSEYKKFLNKNDVSDIKVRRFIHKESFTWKGKKKEINSIEFYYNVDEDDELNSVEKTYKILLRSKKYVRGIISGDVEDSGKINQDILDKL